MKISGNIILITGGTSGIGLELAAQLLKLGNTVIVTGRDRAKLEQTAKQLPNVHTFQSDVADPQAIARLYEQVVKEFPDLNILINNAGEMRKLNLHDPSIGLENITREIDINLSGPVRMVQQFLPHLKTRKTAAIINVTSGLALVPFPLAPIYGATKAGLRSYTKSLRMQLAKTDIKVFELIAPAAKTPLNDKFAGDIGNEMMMDAAKLVGIAIKGLQKDKLEIYPGLAGALKYLSRLAPDLLFKQMSKIAERSFAKGQAANQS